MKGIISKKNYAKTPEGRAAINRASKKAYLKFKEKWHARTKVRRAIKKGLIIKPKNCEQCNEVKKLEGHHEDYTKPLQVIFLCNSCHRKADKLLRSKLLEKS